MAAAFDANDASSVKRFFDDVADPIDHIMVNTTLTGATFDIDGGQQFV